MDLQDSKMEKDDLKQEQIQSEDTKEQVVEPEMTAEAEVPAEEPVQPEPEVEQHNQTAEAETEAEQDELPVSPEMSKTKLLSRMKELIEQEVEQVKDEVESIKQLFYKKSKAETDQQHTSFIESGGNEIDFIPQTPELEAEFKELLNEYRNKKAKLSAQVEQEKEHNLLKKNHIIEQMKQLVESKDDVSANINVFRQLQQDWKNAGVVPASATNELWKKYNQQQEAFWDLIKINNELREYDFKKNLEAKTKLCEIAEGLVNEDDVVSSFRQLQKLHEDWHELGPVARELRQEIWDRFKAASTVVNKKHQSHFEDIRDVEEKNLAMKIALCERIEAVDITHFTSYKGWDDATKVILDMQEEWRSIGFAPRKLNQRVFERYRKACDAFFTAKAEFYKDVKSNLNQNLDKKKALCERAEALKDSVDWKATGDEFVKMQKEWKTIGSVGKKYSDEVWKRFITACDYFFEQKNKNVSGQRGEEIQNLEKKKALIEKIKTFKKTENVSESLAALRALAAEWNGIGHVPFRDKDKIYKEYRTALDTQFDGLNIDATQRRLESFRSNLKDMSVKGENKLYREREKLVRAYENLKAEIATYENNIGFLSIASKKGGGMFQEMERKIESLKDECKLLEQKINMIDENM